MSYNKEVFITVLIKSLQLDCYSERYNSVYIKFLNANFDIIFPCMIWLPDERCLSESQIKLFVHFLPEHSATNLAYIILFLSTNNICEKNALDEVIHTNFFSLRLLFSPLSRSRAFSSAPNSQTLLKYVHLSVVHSQFDSVTLTEGICAENQKEMQSLSVQA